MSRNQISPSQHALFLAIIGECDRAGFEAILADTQPEDFQVNEEMQRSPFLYAAEMNKAPFLGWLLPYSDVAQQDGKGRTALMHLMNPVQSSTPVSKETVAEVLAKSVEIGAQNLANAAGDTALSLAVQAYGLGRPAALVWLPQLLKVCDLNWRNKEGMSLLMLAAQSNNVEAVRLLLPLSDPLLKDNRGETAVEIAGYHQALLCADLLAPASTPELAKAALERNGAHRMPRTQAYVERLALMQELAPPSAQAEQACDRPAVKKSSGISAQNQEEPHIPTTSETMRSRLRTRRV